MRNISRTYERRVEPLADAWRSHSWDLGVFDTAKRSYTPDVEGVIQTPDHVVMVTLNGSAEHLEVQTDCGHCYSGPDRPGAVSFVPADCERRLSLKGVASEWGSIALSPVLFDDDDGGLGGMLAPRPFSNVEDPFAAALIGEFVELSARDGGLDAAYCEAMSLALARHLVHRYGEARSVGPLRDWKLPPWKLRRVADHVEAALEGSIRIADLAAIAELSAGYFHRAFKATTGQTPLDFINARRIRRAKELIQHSDAGLAAIALQVGFISPSHFTRTFRQVTGASPTEYRTAVRGGFALSPARVP